MNVDLEYVTSVVSRHMEGIQKMFKPGAKITVVVRSPNVPGDTDFILTDDDLSEVTKAIQRQQKRYEASSAMELTLR